MSKQVTIAFTRWCLVIIMTVCDEMAKILTVSLTPNVVFDEKFSNAFNGNGGKIIRLFVKMVGLIV